MDIGRISAAMPRSTPTEGATLGSAQAGANARAASTEPSFHVRSMEAFKAETEFGERVYMNHRHLPMVQANAALKTIEEQLGKIQKVINLTRPDIKAKDWDFTVKDGEIKVTGNLEANDKKWIEQVLNSNEDLVSAAKSYVSASVAYLETSEDNPVYGSQNRFTGKMVFYDFKNIEKQFGEVFQFKDVVNTARELYRNTSTGEAVDPGDYLGGDTLEILASKLSPKAVTTS
jgi:hypothetical protein